MSDDTKAVKLFAAFVVGVFYLLFCGITFGQTSTAITVDKDGNVQTANKPASGVVKFGTGQLKVDGVNVVGGSGGGGGISGVPAGRELRVDGVNGNDTNAAAASGGTDVAVPFLTIGAAITSAGSPTSGSPKTIRVGPGTFALGNTKLTVPDYVSLVGAGRDVTIITSTIATTGGAIVVPGNNSTISDLTIQGTATAGVFQVMLGSLTGEQDATGVVVRNVHIIGDTDGVFVQDTSAYGIAMYDCLIETKWDTLIVSSPGTVDASNCTIISTGPSNASATSVTHGPLANATGAIIRWNGGRVTVSGSTVSNHAFIASSAGRVEISGDAVVASSGIGAADIERAGSGVVAVSGLTRSDGAALVGVNASGGAGTFTYISRTAQRDSNLSDLASAATSRTNLGAAADSATVHNTGAETIAGAKEFTSQATVTLAPGLDTIASGSLLRNTSTATVDHVQDSPADDLEGRVFATGGFGSKPVKVRTYAEPVQSAAGSVVRLFGSAVGASATFHYSAALFHLGGLTLGETDVTNLIDPGDGGLHLGSATASTLAGFDASKNLVSTNAFHAGIAVTGGYPIELTADPFLTIRNSAGGRMLNGEESILSAFVFRVWSDGTSGEASPYGDISSESLTDNRTFALPDVSGTLLVQEQTIAVTGTPAFGKVPVASDATHAAWGYINGSTAKVYRALLTQSGTSNPSATVLENSLGGTVTWTFSSTGTYIGTLSSAFPVNKTFLKHGDPVAVADEAILHFTRTSASVVTVVTRSVSSGTWSVQNAMLSNTEVEIFVYP